MQRNVKNKRNMQGARRFLVCQLGMVLMAVVIGWSVWGTMGGQSALLGGLVSVVPNSYFICKLFKYQHAREAHQIVRAFYQGEAVKLGLSAALFAGVFLWLHVMPAVFMIAYISVQGVFWLAPLIFL